MGDVQQDKLEITSGSLDLNEISYECNELLVELGHSGYEFREQNTSFSSENGTYQTRTTLINNFGVCSAKFFFDPKATNVAELVQLQMDGKNTGDKFTGSWEFTDAGGTSTSRYDIYRWHIKSYSIGPFNSKAGSGPLEQTLEFRPEHFKLV